MNNKKFYREDYFIYKGIAYGVGTEVLFNDNITKNREERYRDKPHTFIAGYSNGWKRFIYENSNLETFDRSEISNIIPDRDIKKIVKPIYVELIPVWKKSFDNAISGKKNPDIFGGIILYIIIMLGGLIFKERLLIWVMATIILGIWIIDKFRD